MLRWVRVLSFTIAFATLCLAQSVPAIGDAAICPNFPSGKPPLTPAASTGAFQKIVINAPGAVCNDGSPAVMYVRAAKPGATEPGGSSSDRWVIHFEGGASCSTYDDCLARWCHLGQYSAALMSSVPAPDSIAREGLLGRNSMNRIGDRNLVMLNYCSSDLWSGRKSDVVLRSETDPSKAFSLHYQGATIVSAAFDALEKGVAGMPKLTAASDVLISGDSAGSVGVHFHVDRLAARLKAANPGVRVRAQGESGFRPDTNGKAGFPAGDPRDPVYASKTASYNSVVALMNPQLDDSCLAAHPTAPYLCFDQAYLVLNHITTPLFQIQDLLDPMVLDYFDDIPGYTPAKFAQDTYDTLAQLANARTAAVEKSAITAAPGIAGRLCGIHVTWGDNDGFLGKRIRSALGQPAYSYYDLLWNWMSGAAPSSLSAPRPPDSPAVPQRDPLCAAKAPDAITPSIATASSASYDFTAPVAPDSIVATFGSNLSTTTAVATVSPWPVTLGGVQVQVTDSKSVTRNAPLYFVSPTQLAYMIPSGTASGSAQITIGTQKTSVEIAATAPGIYTASQSGQGVAAGTYIRVTASGARSEGYLFDPATKTDSGVPANPDDQIYLLLYGTGMRGGTATATITDVAVPVAGPVAQGQYQGLDQINLGPLPRRIGYGQKQIVIRQGDRIANIVTFTLKQP